MKVTTEALGPKSGNRLLASGAARIMIPCIHHLDDAIRHAGRVNGPVMAHVPANRISDLQATEKQLADHGITSILALSGNPGHGQNRYTVYDLVEHFSSAGFQVAVGGYPEGYLGTTGARRRRRSVDIIMRKQAAGAHRIITQASFNAANMRKWLVSLRDRGVTLPVHISVMPTVPWRIIRRMMIRTLSENRKHPMRQINMPNIDLLYRVLRSHTQNTFRFIDDVQRHNLLGPEDAFHIFSYGVNVDDLIGKIRSLDLQPSWADSTVS